MAQGLNHQDSAAQDLPFGLNRHHHTPSRNSSRLEGKKK